MIKIYVDNIELDLYGDESIELNRSIKRLTDIARVYTPFTQSFSVPASRTNNGIFKHYYRDDLDQSVSTFQRIPAIITINGSTFETGTILLEGAQINNGVPSSYQITFYGATASLSDITGDDGLNVLDLTSYNHTYESANVINGLDGTGLSSGDVIYPLFSPVRRWIYDSDANHDDNNIAYHSGHGGGNIHGAYYYELKPAIRVTKILEAIEDYYGFTFTGSFLSSSPFNRLFLWLHNREGYIYEGQTLSFEPLNNREIIRGLTITNTPNTPIQGIPVTQQAIFTTSQGLIGGVISFSFEVTFSVLSNDAILFLTRNGVIVDTIRATATSTAYTLDGGLFPSNTSNAVYRIQIGKTTASLTYNLTISANYTTQKGQFSSGGSGASATTASSVTLTEDVVMSNLLPKITIKDFLNGLVRMYNLIVTSEDGLTYNFQTRDSYYGAGDEIELDRWLDLSKVEVNSPPKYKAINFEYNPSDQVLQKQFRELIGRGYGDLVQSFNFSSSDVYSVRVPFDHILTEKLSDQADGTYVNFTVYQSIQVDEDGAASSYYDAPVLFYHNGTVDISSNSISIVDESNLENEVTSIVFAEDISTTTASTAESTTFSQEQNPYLESEPNSNLYSEYWSSQLTGIYDTRARVFSLKAKLNFGLLSRLSLNNTILWRGRKYLINDMNVNLKTGDAELSLVTRTT